MLFPAINFRIPRSFSSFCWLSLDCAELANSRSMREQMNAAVAVFLVGDSVCQCVHQKLCVNSAMRVMKIVWYTASTPHSHVNFKRLQRLTGQMLKRGHYNDGNWWSNYNRTKIQGRSVIVMLLSQVFWRSGACFCLLNTRQLSLWANSPFGDIVKSRRVRGTGEETRKLCRSRVLARLASLAQTGEIARRPRTARINLSFHL